jgi:hypothetical protein
MESQFLLFGNRKTTDDPSAIHVVIPYCLKSPDCPHGRSNSKCTVGCNLCDCETIIRWTKKNGYHYSITRGSIFYESYLPKHEDNLEIIITFSCLADEMKVEVQKAISNFDFSLILLTTALTCRTEDIQEAKEGDAKILNHVDDLEQKLCSIEHYLRVDS